MQRLIDVFKLSDFNKIDILINSDSVMIKSIADNWNKCKKGYKELYNDFKRINDDNFIPNEEMNRYEIQLPFVHRNIYDDENDLYYLDQIFDKTTNEEVGIVDNHYNWLSIPVEEKCLQNPNLVMAVYMYEMTFYGFDDETVLKYVENTLNYVENISKST